MPELERMALKDHPGIEGERLSLEQTDLIFGVLEADIRMVLDDLSHTARTGQTPRYCFDFDVLYPYATKRLTSEVSSYKEEEFWTSLALDLPGFDTVILPGTLFEILNNLSVRISRFGSISKTKLGSAFIKSFNARERDFDDLNDNYQHALDRFRTVKITDPELYLFSLIEQRLQTVRPLPDIDRDIFLEAINFLSRGSRFDRVLNNRVDALNYALIFALNYSAERDQAFRYRLITRSNTVSSLDVFMSRLVSAGGLSLALRSVRGKRSFSADLAQTYSQRIVRTPRQAAIHQLLSLAAKSADQSMKIAWNLLSEITQYRSRLAGIISDAGSRTSVADGLPQRSDDLFVRILSSFESLSRSIAIAKHTRKDRIELVRQIFDFNDPVAFLTKIRSSVQGMLLSEGYKFAIDSNIPGSTTSIITKIAERNTRFNYLAKVDFVPEFANEAVIVCSYLRYEKYHMVIVPSIGIMEEFLSCFNAIRQMIFTKIAAGEIPYHSDDRFEITAGTASSFFEGDCDEIEPRLTKEGIARFFDLSPKDLNFLRIDSRLVSASFEGRACAIASSLELVDEFGFFAQELVSISFRASNIRIQVATVVRQNRI